MMALSPLTQQALQQDRVNTDLRNLIGALPYRSLHKMLSPRALTTLNPVLLEGGTTRTDGRQRESTQDFSTVKGGGKEHIINILNPGQSNDLAISRKERGKEKEREKR